MPPLASRPGKLGPHADELRLSRPSTGVSVFGLIRCGTSASPRATAHIFAPKPRAHCLPALALAIITRPCWARISAFAWHHLQIWAEFHEARFEAPTVGNADTFSDIFSKRNTNSRPQFFGAVRWEQQFFGDGPQTLWRRDSLGSGYAHASRSAAAYRFTPHTPVEVPVHLDRTTTARTAISSSPPMTSRF